MLGMTQMQLAEPVDVSHQQIRKFERGVNRIFASQLHQFARVLAVEIGYFFDGLAGEGAVSPTLQQRVLLLEPDSQPSPPSRTNGTGWRMCRTSPVR